MEKHKGLFGSNGWKGRGEILMKERGEEVV
jgi:hypothetical protein